jgi:hypothetical protein
MFRDTFILRRERGAHEKKNSFLFILNIYITECGK